jgi:hypothetical protein
VNGAAFLIAAVLCCSGKARPGLPSSYVNIYFGAKTYSRIEFRTSIPAFESDNHAFTNAAASASEADAM